MTLNTSKNITSIQKLQQHTKLNLDIFGNINFLAQQNLNKRIPVQPKEQYLKKAWNTFGETSSKFKAP
ncbi:2807_t:CDS:1, partial [Funneliformis mosseae]